MPHITPNLISAVIISYKLVHKSLQLSNRFPQQFHTLYESDCLPFAGRLCLKRHPTTTPVSDHSRISVWLSFPTHSALVSSKVYSGEENIFIEFMVSYSPAMLYSDCKSLGVGIAVTLSATELYFLIDLCESFDDKL